MKKKVFAFLLALCIFYCILFPSEMARSAADGLVLWYASILPTLLPFSIFSNIIIRSGLYDEWFCKLYPVFRYILPVRPACIYPLLAGFVFGFPLGSKICADLYGVGKISRREAEIVSCISNNFGPAFLCNYMIKSLPQSCVPAWIVLISCYFPALILGRLWLERKTSEAVQPQKIPTSRSQINFKIIDAGIMDGFTTMIKLAGYIILFAILADMLQGIPLQNPLLKAACIGALEITNGIRAVSGLQGTLLLKYILSVGFVCFGGISGLFQTSAMLRSTGFCLRNYVWFKLACSLCGICLISSFYLLFAKALLP